MTEAFPLYWPEGCWRDAVVTKSKTAPENGWLIESNHIDGTPHWFFLDHNDEEGSGWTKDSAKALRFARMRDAWAYIHDIGWTGAVPTEHLWG